MSDSRHPIEKYNALTEFIAQLGTPPYDADQSDDLIEFIRLNFCPNTFLATEFKVAFTQNLRAAGAPDDFWGWIHSKGYTRGDLIKELEAGTDVAAMVTAEVMYKCIELATKIEIG